LVEDADASELVAYPVSTRVGKPANNDPQLLDPVPADPSPSARA